MVWAVGSIAGERRHCLRIAAQRAGRHT